MATSLLPLAISLSLRVPAHSEGKINERRDYAGALTAAESTSPL